MFLFFVREYGKRPRKLKNTMTAPTYCLVGVMTCLKKNSWTRKGRHKNTKCGPTIPRFKTCQVEDNPYKAIWLDDLNSGIRDIRQNCK